MMIPAPGHRRRSSLLNQWRRNMQTLAVLVIVLVAGALPAAAQTRVDKNVIYGTYSGLALLLDVHRPARPNGYGLVLVPGSGWQTGQGYGDRLVKDGDPASFVSIPPLLHTGYTLFVVSHRSAPRFRYPAAIEDVQRAVRFVRSRASEYGIRAASLGAVGYSSGAHLATMMGLLDGAGDIADPDPVNRLSARVQCVVASATPTDLEQLTLAGGAATVSFIGMPPATARRADPVAANLYRAASPVTYVARSSAPLLLIHGDADIVVAIQQSELLAAAMQRAGAEVKFIRLPGGSHVFAQELSRHTDWPDVLGETVGWLDQHLKRLPE